ncbi:hypothetical protein [Streptomyces sp. NPDC047123]|uniref:hypothetical protein n=1 Tax=Streptomyces sp. NPDC047123 TaxID=3155622 RepID=UPI0033DC0B6F
MPVDRALVARGALSILVPRALGQAAGRSDLGAVAALGAYGAAVDDSAAPWRTRALVLVLPQFGGALGAVSPRAAARRGRAPARVAV